MADIWTTVDSSDTILCHRNQNKSFESFAAEFLLVLSLSKNIYKETSCIYGWINKFWI